MEKVILNMMTLANVSEQFYDLGISGLVRENIQKFFRWENTWRN